MRFFFGTDEIFFGTAYVWQIEYKIIANFAQSKTIWNMIQDLY